MKVTVLLSGGIDSTACVHFLQGRGHDVRGLFIDFGQAAAAQERHHVQQIVEHFGIPLRVLTASAGTTFGVGELVGRNAFLVFSALLLGRCDEGLLAIGIHAGTPYFDCSPAFVERINPLILESSGGRVSLLAPFLHWSKDDVYSHFMHTGVPQSKTYSCEAGIYPACQTCASCRDRARLECLQSAAH